MIIWKNLLVKKCRCRMFVRGWSLGRALRVPDEVAGDGLVCLAGAATEEEIAASKGSRPTKEAMRGFGIVC